MFFTKINRVHYIFLSPLLCVAVLLQRLHSMCINKGFCVKKQLLSQEMVTMNIPSGLWQSNEAEIEFLALLHLIPRLHMSLHLFVLHSLLLTQVKWRS